METLRIGKIGELNKSEGTLWDEGVCTVCGSKNFLDFFEIKHVPTQDGVLWLTQEESLNAPRGDISLSLCLNCGYIGNKLFDPGLVKFVGYNISLEYSPKYQNFIKTLASGLIERYDLREKSVLEIGCGNGYFLKTICALGRNKGVGFDPSYMDAGNRSANSQEILFIKDYYTESYAKFRGDLICCRQVIDHLGSPKAFLRMVRRLIGEQSDTVVYFEVPNPEQTFQQFVPWNIGYEHGSWFFPETFRSLFQLVGFDIREVSPCNNREYLGIEAIPTPNFVVNNRTAPGIDISQLSDELSTLSHRFQETISVWKDRLQNIETKGIRAIPWGSGGRAINFLNVFDIKDLMPFIIDINPGRIGKYLPGTGQKVVSPEFLIEYKPDLVIITNPTYQSEIQEQGRKLGLNCDFLVL